MHIPRIESWCLSITGPRWKISNTREQPVKYCSALLYWRQTLASYFSHPCKETLAETTWGRKVDAGSGFKETQFTVGQKRWKVEEGCSQHLELMMVPSPGANQKAEVGPEAEPKLKASRSIQLAYIHLSLPSQRFQTSPNRATTRTIATLRVADWRFLVDTEADIREVLWLQWMPLIIGKISSIRHYYQQHPRTSSMGARKQSMLECQSVSTGSHWRSQVLVWISWGYVDLEGINRKPAQRKHRNCFSCFANHYPRLSVQNPRHQKWRSSHCRSVMVSRKPLKRSQEMGRWGEGYKDTISNSSSWGSKPGTWYFLHANENKGSLFPWAYKLL